jgi:hypothetical protein
MFSVCEIEVPTTMTMKILSSGTVHDVLQSGISLPRFRRNLPPTSSGYSSERSVERRGMDIARGTAETGTLANQQQ